MRQRLAHPQQHPLQHDPQTEGERRRLGFHSFVGDVDDFEMTNLDSTSESIGVLDATLLILNSTSESMSLRSYFTESKFQFGIYRSYSLSRLILANLKEAPDTHHVILRKNGSGF